ncbi:MAG: GtrA family protein [Deltaproteobacteria bacterium]|nr:GtrA family protein [Deltaproteobacteria bacterium]
MPELGPLLKHQTGAAISTAVDFGVMWLLVESHTLTPVWATAAGAFCGAVTNFSLGRRWIFAKGPGSMALGNQVARYMLVSGVSLMWNTLGEALLYRVLGLQYVMARVIVAVVVSVAWNYPMHRWFVFRSRPARVTS